MKLNKAFEKVHRVVVDENKVSQRIDNFLITYLKNVPKSKIYRIIRKGEVRVNKKRVKPDYKLAYQDEIRVPPLVRTELKEMSPSEELIELVRSAIIMDDAELMALNKPSGLPVHGGSGLTGGVINILRVMFADYKFIELIHRLDKDTSGCLLIAKTGAALRNCQQAWQENAVEKYYYCLVKGHWPKSLQKIDAPLQKNTLQSGERIVRVDSKGKTSVTYFKPVEYFKNATLLEVRLGTGRTHQIRVHTAHAGHPIAGDSKYGNKDFNLEMKNLGLNRLFLHAYKLVLPETCSKQTELTADLPKVLAILLEKLRVSV